MEKEKINNVLKKDVLSKEKTSKIILYILAFSIPFFVILVIFAILGAFPFGNEAYLPVDSMMQYSNYLEYFGNFLHGGDNFFYSLSKSIGGEMYGTFTYYLISPFNIIALFFDKTIISMGFDLIVAIKTAFTAITFIYFLNRRKETKYSNLIFSSMYALSSYAISYGFNIMWLDAMILLPVVIAGIEDLLDLNKIKLYTISLCLTLITNYYMGFIVCVFSFIYIIYKLILNSKEYKGKILKLVLKFILLSLIAVLIAGIVLIPSYIYIKEGRADFTFSDVRFEENFKAEDRSFKIFYWCIY